MEPTKLEAFLVHILTPVYKLTEDDTIRDTQMGTLVACGSFLLLINFLVHRGTEDDVNGAARPRSGKSRGLKILFRLQPDQARCVGSSTGTQSRKSFTSSNQTGSCCEKENSEKCH